MQPATDHRGSRRAQTKTLTRIVHNRGPVVKKKQKTLRWPLVQPHLAFSESGMPETGFELLMRRKLTGFY